MQALGAGSNTFSPSLFARFPIEDDVFKVVFEKWLGLPTANKIGLSHDLINIALYVAGSVGNKDAAKDQLSGGGICLDAYVFKGVRFTYGMYLTFSDTSKPKPHPIFGIALEIK